VTGTVQKVGIAESDVLGPRGDEAAHILEHHFTRYCEEAPAVHRWDRTMETRVQTSAARLDVSRGKAAPGVQQVRVPSQRGQPVAARQRKSQPLDAGGRIGFRRFPGVDLPRQGHERLLRLASQDVVRVTPQQVLRVERRIQSVKHDSAIRVAPPDPLGGAHTEPQRRVHGDRNRDESSSPHFGFVKRFHGEIDRVRCEPGALEKGAWPCEPERLMAQLVARNEQHGAMVAERAVKGGHGTFRRSAKRDTNATPIRITAIHTSQRRAVAIPASPTTRPVAPVPALSQKTRVISGGTPAARRESPAWCDSRH